MYCWLWASIWSLAIRRAGRTRSGPSAGAYARLDALADKRRWRTRSFGALGVTIVATGCGLLVWLAGRLPWLGLVTNLYFAYAGLALGDLLRQGRRAARFLDNGDLVMARQVVAGLVSREVATLSADDLRRALAESVSENANDGFVAPFLYLILGGAGAFVGLQGRQHRRLHVGLPHAPAWASGGLRRPGRRCPGLCAGPVDRLRHGPGRESFWDNGQGHMGQNYPGCR